MSSPTLIVVSGPGGSGKTTLAHRLGRAISCPVISRDEIKEGMVQANPGFTPRRGDPLTKRTLTTFFAVLHLLLEDGVTLVAEAGFQDHVWRPRLEPLERLAHLRIILCTVPPNVAAERMTRRLVEPQRAAHADLDHLRSRGQFIDNFVPVSMDVPTLRVDTISGYQPNLEAVLAFCGQGGPLKGQWSSNA